MTMAREKPKIAIVESCYRDNRQWLHRSLGLRARVKTRSRAALLLLPRLAGRKKTGTPHLLRRFADG